MSRKLLPITLFCLALVAIASGAAYLYYLNAPSGKNMPETNAPISPLGEERCIITVDGREYDVSPLRSRHPGGDIFRCGTDMSDIFHSQHGASLERIRPYLVE